MLFSYGSYTSLKHFVVDGNIGSREQQFHREIVRPDSEPTSDKSSVLGRLGHRLGLPSAKQVTSPEVFMAVERAYEFVMSQYKLGDQVVLVAESWSQREQLIDALELLSLCLTTGTRPAQAQLPLNAEWEMMGNECIPVRGVVAGSEFSHEHPIVASNQLVSRFPASIEHIIWAGSPPSNDSTCTCSTIRSSTGQITSKEACFYPELIAMTHPLIHASKHLIHYKADSIPNWDQHPPTWKRAYTANSKQPPQGFQDWMPRWSFEDREPDQLEPMGMNHHQLELYAGVCTHNGHCSCLVWKSFID